MMRSPRGDKGSNLVLEIRKGSILVFRIRRGSNLVRDGMTQTKISNIIHFSTKYEDDAGSGAKHTWIQA